MDPVVANTALARLPERVWLPPPGQEAQRDACMTLAEELGAVGRVRFPG